MRAHAAVRPLREPRARSTRRLDVLGFLNDRFLWLPLGSLIALVWANVAGESYFRAARDIAFPVNQIGMALFLGLIAQDAIEAVMPGGALHAWRQWTMALLAAIGGLAGAAFTYLALVSWRHEVVLVPAWPVAAAIDIAAGYWVLRLIFAQKSAWCFLLLIGFATNAVGVLVLVFRPAFTTNHLGGAVLLLAAVAVAALLRHRGVARLGPYFALAGSLSWLGFFIAGVHPALALVPIVPFLPHRARPPDVFSPPTGDGPVQTSERRWATTAQVVLFFFGFVNAGVVLRGFDTGTWAVVTAAVVGRPLGILAALGLAVSAGLKLPRAIGWRDAVVIAVATSSGFTFALFAATSLLPLGGVLTQIRLGALATGIGAVLAYGLARALHVGRFARHGH